MSLLQRDLASPVSAPDIDRSGAARWVAERLTRIQLLAGFVVALGYIGATAMSNDGLATALAAAAAAIALVSPTAGLAVLAVILPMHEPELFEPLYVDAVILGATALGCALRLPGDTRALRIHPSVVLAIGYGIYTLLSIVPVISGHPGEWAPTAALQAVRTMTGVGTFIVASYLFRWVSPMPIIVIALFSAFLAAILALAAFWRIGPIDAFGGLLSPIGAFEDPLSPLRVERANGGFSNANYLGFFATQGTLLALGCLSIARARFRPFLAVIAATLVAALILSYSRSAYIGVVAGTVVLAYLRSPRTAIVLVVVAVSAAAILYPAFLEARIGADVLGRSGTIATAQSENWRSLAAGAGVSMFLAEPVFGVGFGVFHYLSPAFIGASEATYSHNAYIQILAEQGLVGCIMVAGIVVPLGIALVRSASGLRGAALAMGCAYLIQSLFINSATSIQISGLLCITMAAALSAAGSRQDTRPEEA